MRIFKNVMKVFVFVFLVVSVPDLSFGDDVLEAIGRAQTSYERGDVRSAQKDLEFALSVMRQEKAESLKGLLPDIPEGWESTEAVHSDIDRSMFGGGLSAERLYKKGEARVRVNIVTDSPVVQGMMAMFSNPMLVRARGARLERISGHEAIVRYDPEARQGEINVSVDEKFFITVEGHGVTLDQIKLFASAVHYDRF